MLTPHIPGLLSQLHSNTVKIRSESQLQLPGQPDSSPRARVYGVRKHHVELRRPEEAELRLHQEPADSVADPRPGSEHPRQQQDPAHPAVLHGHDPERARLQGHSLRVRSYADADSVRRQSGSEFEHVGSNKTPPAAIFSVHLQDEKLHLVLLHHVGVAEGESDHGS